MHLLPMLLLALQLFVGPATAQSTERVLVNAPNGLALEGYDPVSFFEGTAPVRGLPTLTAVHLTATYRFSTEEHRQRFLKEPARYAPAYGGFCAYGMARGYTAPVQISTAQIVDGRLMLNYDAGIQRRFDRDRAEYVRKADANWPRVKEKEGRVIARAAT